jgi:hypothetical protein
VNNARRKDLAKVREYLEAANQPLADAMTDLEGIRDDEQEAYDSVEENFPGSERAEAMQEAISALEEAISAVQTMTESYDEALAAIETAEA